MKMEKGKSGFIRVKCHECGNEQVIFGHLATIARCSKCSAELAVPRGGKAAVRAEILELI